VGAAVAVVMAAGSGSAAAQEDDSLALKMAEAAKPGRFFMRAGAIFVKVKTKSGDTYDVTGPLVTRDDLVNAFATQAGRNQIALPDIPLPATGTSSTPDGFRQAIANFLNNNNLTIPQVLKTMDEQGLSGLGTPPGVKGIASKQAETLGISIGYYLDEDMHWAVEAYVLAAPLKASVSGQGTTVRQGLVTPIAIDGQKIIDTKLLPPTVILGRYFGSRDAKFRPFVGGLGTYGIFYDTKATEALNNYVGGSSPGDTTVAIKNAFGIGPAIGFKYQFSDKWHASLNIGHVKLKTKATLTTRNTTFNGNSAVLQDLGQISDDFQAGEGAYAENCGPTDRRCQSLVNSGGLKNVVLKAILAGKGQENFGTFSVPPRSVPPFDGCG
ncbi:MAG: hypothetical protein EOP50_02745, partial [Sphingobacteriales bacterium]